MDEGQANPWDSPAGDPPAANEPATAASAPPAPPVAGAPAAAPAAPAADGEATSNKVVPIAIAVFVVILVAGYFLSRGGNKNNSSSNTSSGSGQTTTTAAAAPTADSVAITGTTDTFARPNSASELGAMPNGTKWTVQTGGWGISNDSAYLSVPDTAHRNVAWVGTGYASGMVQVKITTMVPEAGIVFRYSGPCSYWSIESSPAVASWNIFKVEKCKAQPEGNTGYSPVGNGVTIGAIWTADKITVVVNGKVAKTLENSDLAGAGKVGMVVMGKDAGKARFTDFIAGGPKGQGIVRTGAKKPAKPGAGATTTAPAGITPTTTK